VNASLQRLEASLPQISMLSRTARTYAPTSFGAPSTSLCGIRESERSGQRRQSLCHLYYQIHDFA